MATRPLTEPAPPVNVASPSRMPTPAKSPSSTSSAYVAMRFWMALWLDTGSEGPGLGIDVASSRLDAGFTRTPAGASKRSGGEGRQRGFERSLEALAGDSAVPEHIDTAADRQQRIGDGVRVGVRVDVPLILRRADA